MRAGWLAGAIIMWAFSYDAHFGDIELLFKSFWFD